MTVSVIRQRLCREPMLCDLIDLVDEKVALANDAFLHSEAVN